MLWLVAFADFWVISQGGSEVGARNGQKRLKCGPERPIRVAAEVRRHSQEPARVHGNCVSGQEKAPTEIGWGFSNGGGGGNRTRVQEYSTDSSTYLALPFDLIRTTRTCTLRQDESPFV